MFTTRFKITVGVIILGFFLATLFVNQMKLTEQIKELKMQKQAVKTVVVTATPAPSATPTATMKFFPATRPATPASH